MVSVCPLLPEGDPGPVSLPPDTDESNVVAVPPFLGGTVRGENNWHNYESVLSTFYPCYYLYYTRMFIVVCLCNTG